MPEPTLRQLRYLVALADERHFGNAAAACWVSQPNLSAQIRQLEKAVGAELVERGARRVLLTAPGEAVVARARTILEQVDGLMGAARAADEPFRGLLRLGVIPTVAPYLLPRILPAVRAAYPGIQLRLHEDFTHRLTESLADGRLDLVLAALPLDEPGLTDVEIAQEPFVLVVPAKHPLAEGASPAASVLEPAELLLLHEGHCLRDQALDVCGVEPGRSRTLIEGTSLSTLVQMVAGGLGVTLLPLSALPVDLPDLGSARTSSAIGEASSAPGEAGGSAIGDVGSAPAEARGSSAGGRREVRARRFAAPVPGRTLGLAWRASSNRGHHYQTLVELLRAETASVLREAEAILAAHDPAPSHDAAPAGVPLPPSLGN